MNNDLLLDTALQAATGLAQLLQFRHDCTTAITPSARDAATQTLISAREQLRKAADASDGFFELRRDQLGGRASRRAT